MGVRVGLAPLDVVGVLHAHLEPARVWALDEAEAAG